MRKQAQVFTVNSDATSRSTTAMSIVNVQIAGPSGTSNQTGNGDDPSVARNGNHLSVGDVFATSSDMVRPFRTIGQTSDENPAMQSTTHAQPRHKPRGQESRPRSRNITGGARERKIFITLTYLLSTGTGQAGLYTVFFWMTYRRWIRLFTLSQTTRSGKLLSKL